MVHGTRALLRLGYIASQNTVEGKGAAEQKEKQRKMVLAMAADLRIVMLRLASRLQSLRWYARSRQPCPPEFARETMTLFTPLANRLGIWQVKWEMEDLAFRFLEPQTYKDIARQLEDKRVEREALIDRVVLQLREALAAASVKADVSGRPKHIYSIWNKMRNKISSFPNCMIYAPCGSLSRMSVNVTRYWLRCMPCGRRFQTSSTTTLHAPSPMATGRCIP